MTAGFSLRACSDLSFARPLRCASDDIVTGSKAATNVGIAFPDGLCTVNNLPHVGFCKRAARYKAELKNCDPGNSFGEKSVVVPQVHRLLNESIFWIQRTCQVCRNAARVHEVDFASAREYHWAAGCTELKSKIASSRVWVGSLRPVFDRALRQIPHEHQILASSSCSWSSKCSLRENYISSRAFSTNLT